MNNKLKFLIIFSIVLFAGLFISAKSAKAQTYIDWFPSVTGLSSSCNASGTTATFSWNNTSPYVTYVRIWNNTTGAWAGLVPEWWDIGGATSMQIATTPGHNYSWWMHVRDGWGNWGPQSNGSPFTCPNPPPPPSCSSSTPDGDTVYNDATVRFYAWDVGNASSVLFYTWSDSGGQDDLIARWGTQSGSTWYVDVSMSSHPGNGVVRTHVYMNGTSTVYCDQSYVITVSHPAPSCSSSTPDGTAVYNDTTPRFYANGVSEATSVLFYTWSESGGQDDIIGRWGTQSGSTWYVDVGLGSHPGNGNVITHVYMFNAYYGATWCDQSTVIQYAPLATSISASPTSVAYGGSSTISWSSTSASTCGIGLQSGGPAPPGGTGGTSGSWVATGMTTNTQYFISCNGVAGGNTGSYSQVITVAPPPPSCTSATPDGTTVYGNTVQRVYANGVANTTAMVFPTWSASGWQDDIVWYTGINAGGGTWYADINLNSHPGYGTVYTNPYMSSSSYGNTACDTASYTTVAPLAATISANPTTVAYGGSSTITWSSTSASTCAIGLDYGGPTPPGGTGGTSGSWVASSMTTTTRYFISCNGVAGGNTGAYSQVITVTTQNATGVLDTNANSSNNNGNCSTFSGWAWDPDGPNTAIQLHIYHNGAFYTNISAGDYRGDLPGNGNHAFTYAIPGAWKDGANHNIAIFSIDLNGGSNLQLIYSPVTSLVCSPPTVDIRANGSNGPISINYNTSATLSWTSTNATSCTLFVNGLNTGWTGTAQPSVATGNMTSSNTYRVDCTGGAGSATDSVIININQQPTCTSATPDGEWTVATTGNRTTQALGVSGATSVTFPTWSDSGGQDDIIWYTGVQSGTTWTVNIPLSSHWEVGNVNVHVYMNNANYTGIFCDSATFTRLNAGTINVNSNTPTTWTVNCPLTNPTCPNVNSGAGQTSGSYPSQPYSNWTITPADIPGYDWKVNACALNVPCAGTFQ